MTFTTLIIIAKKNNLPWLLSGDTRLPVFSNCLSTVHFKQWTDCLLVYIYFHTFKHLHLQMRVASCGYGMEASFVQLIFFFFFIEQSWTSRPFPRSEIWTVCFLYWFTRTQSLCNRWHSSGSLRRCGKYYAGNHKTSKSQKAQTKELTHDMLNNNNWV